MTQWRILAGIFLFSFSSLCYEIALTRVFSISLSYHFAFMVISIAMLGVGASGTALSILPVLRTSPNGSVSSRIGLYGLLLGVGITISYIATNHLPFDLVRLSWDRLQILYICLYYLLLSIPFFFFGLCISTAFSALSQSSGLLYGADLLGAGAGSLSILCLMGKTGPEYAILFVSSIALAGAFIAGKAKTKVFSAILIALNFSLLSLPPLISPRMSPYKGLQLAMKFPGAEHVGTYHSPFSRIDIFRSPAARFAPGLSLRYLDSLPEQLGLSIDGGEMNAITSAGGSTLSFLEFLPSSLPYSLAGRDDVLILEPRGGLEVLLARHFRSRNIVKVDSNPLVIRVTRDDFNDFSGGIYEESTWGGLGRSWLKARREAFDLIDIPLAGASPTGAFGIGEDYRFTVEAFKEYLGHLKKDGVLGIHLFILPPPRVELRILNTLVKSIAELGMEHPDERIVAIRSWGSVSILAKKEPFTPEEIEKVRRFSAARRFDLIHLPGIREEETNIYVRTPSNEYFTAFRSILSPETRESFQRDYLFDIAPVRDENPFFHYYLRLGNIKGIYEIMGGKWQYFIEEGYLLPAVFFQVLLLSIVLVALPALSRAGIGVEEKRKFNLGSNLHLLYYFAFLGLGFMFVEIPLIQKMILPLENSSYAMAAVLTSILISSGAGSLLSYRLAWLRSRFILPVVTLHVAVYTLLLPFVPEVLPSFPVQLRIVFIFLFLFPLGLLMGIPFPLGIKKLGETRVAMIPWAWAVNGCLSVLAPVAAIMLAMVVGFKGVMWIGAAAYLLAFFTFPAPEPVK